MRESLTGSEEQLSYLGLINKGVRETFSPNISEEDSICLFLHPTALLLGADILTEIPFSDI